MTTFLLILLLVLGVVAVVQTMRLKSSEVDLGAANATIALMSEQVDAKEADREDSVARLEALVRDREARLAAVRKALAECSDPATLREQLRIPLYPGGGPAGGGVHTPASAADAGGGAGGA